MPGHRPSFFLWFALVLDVCWVGTFETRPSSVHFKVHEYPVILEAKKALHLIQRDRETRCSSIQPSILMNCSLCETYLDKMQPHYVHIFHSKLYILVLKQMNYKGIKILNVYMHLVSRSVEVKLFTELKSVVFWVITWRLVVIII